MDSSAHIDGDLAQWPSKERMAQILRDAGLKIYVGTYSIRVEDCSHFVFQEYGGDLGNPTIDADADSPEDMLREGELVSNALAKAGIIHRFEIYPQRDGMVAYLHYNWPLDEGA